MLIGINPILTGDLLQILCNMGHSDEIVIAYGNFPAHSHARQRPPIELPINDVFVVIGAILEVFPVDAGQDSLGYTVESKEVGPPEELLRQFSKTVIRSGSGSLGVTSLRSLSALNFYQRTQRAYAIVATVDPRHWACYVIRKGALPEPAK